MPELAPYYYVILELARCRFYLELAPYCYVTLKLAHYRFNPDAGTILLRIITVLLWCS